jgi:hypothetical protein
MAPDGGLYASENVPGGEQTTLVRIRGGTREVLAELHGVQHPLHGRRRLLRQRVLR